MSRPTGNRNRPRRHRPAPINPLAPLSEKALRRQTSADVRAQVAPIAALIQKNALAGSQNISGVSQALAAKLGSYADQARGIYAGAEQNLGAIDSELANRLGAGDIAGDLKKRIAAAGGDTSLADALASASQGAAGAGFARGAAERGQLVSQGAAAEGYASKLPGLAELAGLQGVNERQAQALKETGELTAKTPGLIAQALADARNREYQKAVARLGFQGDVYSATLGYKAKQASTAETARGHDQAYAAKVEGNRIRQNAIEAENQRTGQTLAERAREHDRSLEEQRRRDQQSYQARTQANRERARHNRQTEKHQRRTEKKGKSKGGSPSGLGG